MRGRTAARAASLLALALALWAAPARGATPSDSATEARLTDVIAESMRAGGYLEQETLTALRELRDPALRPLFAQLATSDEPLTRAQAILALAEISTEGRADVFLLRQVDSPQDQLTILRMALDTGLVGDAELAGLLERPGVGDELRAFAMLLTALEREPTWAEILPLLASDNPETAARAAVLALHASASSRPASDEPLDPDAVLRRSIHTDSAGARADAFALLFDLRHAAIPEGAAAASIILETAAENALLRAEAVASLLALDPETGALAWRHEFDTCGDLAQKIRIALLALELDPLPPAAIVALQESEQSLLSTLGAAAGAVAEAGVSGAPPSPEPLHALIAMQHAPSTHWLLGAAEGAEWAPELLETIVLQTARQAPAAPALRADMTDACVAAAAALVVQDTERFQTLLTRASESRDTALAATLLRGALRTSPSLLNLSMPVETLPWPDDETAALAALLAARTDQPISEELSARLCDVAFRFGRLSAPRRAQAAWLALRHDGRIRPALARILAPEP